MASLLVGLMMFISPSAHTIGTSTQSPDMLVQQTAEELLEALATSSENSSEHIQIVEEVLLSKVDIQTISKFVMGKDYYLSATDSQRQAFQRTFQKNLVATYSGGLSLLKGHSIQVMPVPSNTLDKKITGVSVLVTSQDGKVVPMSFTLRRDDSGSWKIINVILNGYNVAYAYHKQFLETLKQYNGDIDHLIANWDGKSSKADRVQTSSKYRDSSIPGWKLIEFEGNTKYEQKEDCVEAVSSGSASGLIKEFRKDLSESSTLRWSWKANQAISMKNRAPEKSKAGDDFLARVYVIKEGTFPWQTKAINYVWSREHAVGDYWHNPFVKNAIMLVVQSGEDGLGKWHDFNRDIKADFKTYHDMDIDRIDAVALMTDTDQSGGRAEACYKLPYFENR